MIHKMQKPTQLEPYKIPILQRAAGLFARTGTSRVDWNTRFAALTDTSGDLYRILRLGRTSKELPVKLDVDKGSGGKINESAPSHVNPKPTLSFHIGGQPVARINVTDKSVKFTFGKGDGRTCIIRNETQHPDRQIDTAISQEGVAVLYSADNTSLALAKLFTVVAKQAGLQVKTTLSATEIVLAAPQPHKPASKRF